MVHIAYTVNKQPPNVLFHYSDFRGLNGIVVNNEIWMGNLFFLNDEKEYELGLEVFKRVLEQKKEQYAGTPFLIFLNSLNGIESLLKDSAPLSFSLTEEGDLLSQWRGYTNNGIGVSIGLNCQILKGDSLLLPCIYHTTEQEEYIEYIVSLAYEIFSSTKETGKHDKSHCENPLEMPYWDAINEAGRKFIGQINVACSIIKHSTFSEEKEWRLISFDRSGIEFIPKETFIKPIKKIKVATDGLVNSIKVGPNPNQNLCVNSIEEMIRVVGRNNISITKSEIPYRN